MQGYYNIPYMAGGGALFSLAGSTSKYIEKLLGSEKGVKKLRGLQYSLIKKNPTLSGGIKNLLDKKLDAKGLEDLQKLAKEHLVKSTIYKDRLRNLQNTMRYRKQALDLLKKAEATESKLAEQTAAENTVEQAAEQAAENVVKQKRTLGSIWNGTKNWMNNHPGWTIGVPAIGLGTGVGRWLLGNGLAATQSSPSNWFGGDSTSDSSEFIMINGTKIPIKKSPDGYFVPVDASSESTQQSSESTDEVDAVLNTINNSSDLSDNQQAASQTGQQGTDQMPQYSQQDINDLFATDQW